MWRGANELTVHALDLTSVASIQNTFRIEVHFTFGFLMGYRFVYVHFKIPMNAALHAKVLAFMQKCMVHFIFCALKRHYLYMSEQYCYAVNVSQGSDSFLADVLFQSMCSARYVSNSKQ